MTATTRNGNLRHVGCQFGIRGALRLITREETSSNQQMYLAGHHPFTLADRHKRDLDIVLAHDVQDAREAQRVCDTKGLERTIWLR